MKREIDKGDRQGDHSRGSGIFQAHRCGFVAWQPGKGEAKRWLGWNPRSTSFHDLIRIMVEHDLGRQIR
jgi:hypothetical protein